MTVRHLLVLVFVLAAMSTWSAGVAEAQCGETVDVAPRHASAAGGAPLALGDSVLYDAAQPLASDGFHVNAMVCRTVQQGIAYLAPRASSLPALVVFALGTNGTASSAEIGTVLRILGPDRMLGLVTPKGGDDPHVPELYRTLASQNPRRILLLDWQAESAGHPEWFAPDGIHLGGSAGIRALAQLIASLAAGSPASVSGATPPPLPTPAPAAGIPPATPSLPPSTSPTPPSPPPAHTRRGPRVTFSSGDRDQMRRIVLDVRLLSLSAISAAIGPFTL